MACDDGQTRMLEGSEFQTEGAATWSHGRQNFCRPKKPTRDWCWRSVENVQYNTVLWLLLLHWFSNQGYHWSQRATRIQAVDWYQSRWL